MHASNKPVLWLPFAAGGMLAALALPAVILVVLLDSLGQLPAGGLHYARVSAWIGNPWLALLWFAFLSLVLWHAAHRLRMTLQDLGVRSQGARRVAARLCYLVAGFSTFGFGYLLLIR